MSHRPSSRSVRRLTRVAALAGVAALVAVWATRDAPRPHRAPKPVAARAPEVVSPPLEGLHRKLAVRALRRFLALYMRATAGRPLTGDDDRLAEIAAPHVAEEVVRMGADPADLAGLRARVTEADVDGTARHADAAAVIDSAGIVVTLRLTMTQRAGRWQVTDAWIDAPGDSPQ